MQNNAETERIPFSFSSGARPFQGDHCVNICGQADTNELNYGIDTDRGGGQELGHAVCVKIGVYFLGNLGKMLK